MSEEETRVARQLREAAQRSAAAANDIMVRVAREAIHDHFYPTPRPPRANISPMFIGEDPLMWAPLEYGGEEVKYEPRQVIEVRQRKVMGRVLMTWECLYRPVTPPAYAHRLEAVLNPKAPTDERLDVSFNPLFERGVSFLTLQRINERLGRPPIWMQDPDDE